MGKYHSRPHIGCEDSASCCWRLQVHLHQQWRHRLLVWGGHGRNEKCKTIATEASCFLIFVTNHSAHCHTTNGDEASRTPPLSIHWQLPYCPSDEVWQVDECRQQWTTSNRHTNPWPITGHNIHIYWVYNNDFCTKLMNIFICVVLSICVSVMLTQKAVWCTCTLQSAIQHE